MGRGVPGRARPGGRTGIGRIDPWGGGVTIIAAPNGGKRASVLGLREVTGSDGTAFGAGEEIGVSSRLRRLSSRSSGGADGAAIGWG